MTEPCAPHVFEHRLLDYPYQGEPSPLEPEPVDEPKPPVKKPAAKEKP